MSGANEKIDPADCAPKIIDMKHKKNWNMSYSRLPMSVPPYQKPRAKHRKMKDWDAAYNKLDLRIEIRLLRCCLTRESRYKVRTSSSRVSDATVRMADMASEANVADEA